MYKQPSKASLLLKCVRLFHILEIDRNELIISAKSSIPDANLNAHTAPLPE